MTVQIYNADAPRFVGKMGRRAAKHPVGLARVSAYGKLPTAPAVCLRPNFASIPWGMLGNDRYGDCTFAGYWHALMAQCSLAGLPIPAATDQAVIDAYLAFTGGADAGCNEADVLGAAFSTGLLGQTLDGYALGEGGVVELCQFINTFGIAYLGVWLTATDQQNFADGKPWDVGIDTAPIGGHCIDAVEYDSTTGMAKVLTWGAEQLVTFAWLKERVEEQWAIISDAIDGKAIDGFDFKLLEADLQAVGGRVNPGPPSSAPEPVAAGPVTVALPTTTPAVPLPNWTDAGSITGYIVSLTTLVISILTSLGVVLPDGSSDKVSAWAGIAGVVVAAGFQLVNFVRVTVLHKAAIVSGHPVAIKPPRKL